VSVYWFVLAIVVIIAVAVYGRHLAAERTKAMAAWARQRGLAFARGPDRDMRHRFLEFQTLSRGRSHLARNIATGEVDGREVTVFDYRYVTGSGKNRRTHRLTCVLVKADLPLIPLRIRREHFFDRLGEAFGFDDIDFESAEFSRRFRVDSTDRKWAFDVIHARTIEYLLREGEWPLELAGWHCLVYRPGRFDPADLDRAIALARGLLDLIPDYVRREILGPGPGPAQAEE